MQSMVQLLFSDDPTVATEKGSDWGYALRVKFIHFMAHFGRIFFWGEG